MRGPFSATQEFEERAARERMFHVKHSFATPCRLAGRGERDAETTPRPRAPCYSKCSAATSSWWTMSMPWGHMASQAPQAMHAEAGPGAACHE